ncbi:unnamed protein product [Blepharisma stoltei]|uniref:Uncharacterized protein n=1 Tax=Blepharisma stoltei TaxID=1481888 RepID=A0AAU9INV1_9CILI|nr:unnamed protein product [Blepharisma stoltei]
MLAIIISFAMMLLYIEFLAEIRHSASKKTLKAKAHSKIDAHLLLFSFSFPIAYAILAENHILYLHILAFIFPATLIKEVLTLLPYYSFFAI